MAFDHFDSSLLRFLEELKANNNREWFQANKPRFEAKVQRPLLAFIEALGPRIEKISPHMTAIPKKSGGSLTRIYRDTRFSKDKTPYHEYVQAHFQHREGRKLPTPCFYFRLSAETLWLGGGVYLPPAPVAEQFRHRIDQHPEEWIAARDDKRLKKLYGGYRGEPMKRPPRGWSKDHPLIDDLQRKDWGAIRELPAEAATKKDFIKEVEKSYQACAPIVGFFLGASGLEF